MTDTHSNTAYERAIRFLAAHRNIERASYMALGVASFVVFFLPILIGNSWFLNNGYKLPYFGSESMFWPNVALRILCMFGPSVIAMAFFYRFLRNRMELPIKRLRQPASQA